MTGPLQNLEQWDDFVASRYDPEKKAEDFRNYERATPGVREFYRLNHTHQTRDFVLRKMAVADDTFPAGCAGPDKIVFSDYFRANADSARPEYRTRLGVYQGNCGLDNVDLSWRHFPANIAFQVGPWLKGKSTAS